MQFPCAIIAAVRRSRLAQQAVTPTSVTVLPSSPVVVVGRSTQLSAVNQVGQPITSQLVWSSSDNTKATINSSTGVVTGVAAGSVTFTASWNSGALTGTKPVTVQAQVLTTAALTTAPVTIVTTHTVTFAATGYDQLGFAMTVQPTFTYASGTPATATINSSTGVATGVATGTTTITATSGAVTTPGVTLTDVAQTLASITISPAAPTVSNGTGQTFTASGTDTLGGSMAVGAGTWGSSDPTDFPITSGGVCTPSVDSGSAVVEFTETASGISGTTTITAQAASVTYATPLFRDDMGYVTKKGLLNNVNLGGTGGGSALYSEIQEDPAVTISVDESVTYNGFSCLRYDFLATANLSTGAHVAIQTGDRNKVWVKFRTRYKSGFTTAGVAAGGNAQAYKLHEYVFNTGVGNYFGSGRLEISNTVQYDNYYTVYQNGPAVSGTVSCSAGAATFSVSQASTLRNGDTIHVGSTDYTVSAFNGTTGCTLSGAPTFGASAWTINQRTIAAPNNAGRDILNEWTDDNWYDNVCLTTISADGKTRTTKWWAGIADGPLVLISTTGTAMSDGNAAPPINSWVFGANFNQARSSTVTLYRGAWDIYDAGTYRNPYSVPSADFTDVVSTLGSDTSIEAPVVAPAAPGAVTAANSTVQTAHTLTFPVTQNAAGSLARGVAVRVSTDGGSTWSASADIAILSPSLGGTVNLQVLGLTNSQAYTVQFAAKNPGGTSAWSSSVTGTTIAVDLPPVTSGLVLDIDVSQGSSTYTDGVGISQLTDLSTTGLNYTQATGANQPILKIVNGLPIARFSTGKYLLPAAYNAALGSTSCTVFVVGNASTSVSGINRSMFDNEDATGKGWACQVTMAQSADAPRFNVTGFNMGGAARGTQLHDMCLVLTPTLASTFTDGGSPDGAAVTYVPNTTLASAIGTLASNIGTQTGEFDLAQIIVYNRALTTTERQSVEAAIRSQWGTP